MPQKSSIEQVWDKVVEDVKQKVIRPTLWRSMEIAQPIIMEGDWFVVGFPPGSYHMSGNLTTGDHQNAIERGIQQFTGERLKLRIIEGDSLEDWQHVKYKDQHLDKLREAAASQRAKEADAAQAWENLLEQISRRYAATPNRQLPQSRARYVRRMLLVLSTTMDEIMPQGTEPDELNERALARALEKLASITDIPASLIALQLMQLRGE